MICCVHISITSLSFLNKQKNHQLNFDSFNVNGFDPEYLLSNLMVMKRFYYVFFSTISLSFCYCSKQVLQQVRTFANICQQISQQIVKSMLE